MFECWYVIVDAFTGRRMPSTRLFKSRERAQCVVNTIELCTVTRCAVANMEWGM